MTTNKNRAVIAQQIDTEEGDELVPFENRYLISMDVEMYEQALRKVERLIWHYQQTDNITRQLVSQGLLIGPHRIIVGNGYIQKLKPRGEEEYKPSFYSCITDSDVCYVPEDSLDHVVFSEGSIALGPNQYARVEFVIYFMSGCWKTYLLLDGGHPDIRTCSSELNGLATSRTCKMLEGDVLPYKDIIKLPKTPVSADEFFRIMGRQHIFRVQSSVISDTPVTRVYDIHGDKHLISFCHPGTKRKIFSVNANTQVVYNQKEGFYIFSDVGGMIRKIAPVLAYQVSL